LYINVYDWSENSFSLPSTAWLASTTIGRPIECEPAPPCPEHSATVFGSVKHMQNHQSKHAQQVIVQVQLLAVQQQQLPTPPHIQHLQLQRHLLHIWQVQQHQQQHVHLQGSQLLQSQQQQQQQPCENDYSTY
jgi:hypothetical protein